MIETSARVLSRVLTGSTYLLLGYDAFASPGARVGLAGPTLAAMRRVLPLPDDDELVVRANGAVQAVAGAALVAGVAPRTAALALVGSMVPTTVAGHAFWKVEDPAARKTQQVQFVKNLAMVGGLIAIASRRRS